MKTKAFFIVSLLVFAVFPRAFAGHIDLPRDENGWTRFTPSPDSRILYVSAAGNDDTGEIYSPASPEIGSDPLEPSGTIQPFATYSAAYANARSGFPDWILFKRGDTFYSYIGDAKSGRSETEPSLVGAYGSGGNSPVIKHGGEMGLRIQRSSLSGGGLARYVAISGITFYAHTRDPQNTAEYTGTEGAYGLNIATYSNANVIDGILLEGCKWLYPMGNNLSAGDGSATKNIIFRRCIFLHSYPTTGHVQGLYATEVDGIKLEENIFDHNGWYSPAGSEGIGIGTIYNHNTYFSATKNVLFKDNIFMRGSNINNKFTSKYGDSHDITIENNLYVGGHIGISIGVNYTSVPLRFQNISIRNNVLTNLGMDNVTGQGIAWGIQVAGWKNGIVSNNIIMNQIGELPLNGSVAFDVWGGTTCDISGNVIYRLEDNSSILFQSTSATSNFNFTNNAIQNPYSSPKLISTYNDFSNKLFRGNKYYDADLGSNGFYYDESEKSFSAWVNDSGDTSTFEQVSFPDATRSVNSYMISIGEPETIDAFIAKCRAQDRYNWDTRFTSDAVNDYIRAGFGVSEYTPPGQARRLSLAGRPIKLAEPGP